VVCCKWSIHTACAYTAMQDWLKSSSIRCPSPLKDIKASIKAQKLSNIVMIPEDSVEASIPRQVLENAGINYVSGRGGLQDHSRRRRGTLSLGIHGSDIRDPCSSSLSTLSEFVQHLIPFLVYDLVAMKTAFEELMLFKRGKASARPLDSAYEGCL
jgi:hypothetical protein